MDIEKLKSIIRLANNNPNEHEANLAARKACKLLAENNFALLNGKSFSRDSKPKGSASSKEPEVDFTTIYEELMRKQREAEKRREANARKAAEEARQRTAKQKEEQHRNNWNPYDPIFSNFNPFRTSSGSRTRSEDEFRRTYVEDPDIFEQTTKERQEKKQKNDKELYQRCAKCRNMAWGPKTFAGDIFLCHGCIGTQYKKTDSQFKKKCPRCRFDIYFNWIERAYNCVNPACAMKITEQEWVNIGK